MAISSATPVTSIVKAFYSIKNYFCWFMIYVPELQKSIVFFQATIGGLDQLYNFVCLDYQTEFTNTNYAAAYPFKYFCVSCRLLLLASSFPDLLILT